MLYTQLFSALASQCCQGSKGSESYMDWEMVIQTSLSIDDLSVSSGNPKDSIKDGFGINVLTKVTRDKVNI